VTATLEPLLKVPEVAALLGLRPKSVYDLVESGKLPHFRLGPRTIRFARADLIAWLDGRKRAPNQRSR
jgi:excisionase family DNA binding protein